MNILLSHLSLLAIIALSSVHTPVFGQEQGVFIVNQSVPATELTNSDLEAVYLGRKELWSNDIRVRPCYPSGQNSLQNMFFEKVLHSSQRKFKRYWLKMVFSGYGTEPSAMRTHKDTIEYVSSTLGAIGFIPQEMAAEIDGATVVMIHGEKDF